MQQVHAQEGGAQEPLLRDDGGGADGAGSARQREAEKSSRRAAWLAKVPEEPPLGAAGCTKIAVHVGGAVHWRRFGSWHTLEDLANFCASLADTEISITNITVHPAQRLELATDGGFTLQRLDLWPSGHVEVAAAA